MPDSLSQLVSSRVAASRVSGPHRSLDDIALAALVNAVEMLVAALGVAGRDSTPAAMSAVDASIARLHDMGVRVPEWTQLTSALTPDAPTSDDRSR